MISWFKISYEVFPYISLELKEFVGSASFLKLRNEVFTAMLITHLPVLTDLALPHYFLWSAKYRSYWVGHSIVKNEDSSVRMYDLGYERRPLISKKASLSLFVIFIL